MITNYRDFKGLHLVKNGDLITEKNFNKSTLRLKKELNHLYNLLQLSKGEMPLRFDINEEYIIDDIVYYEPLDRVFFCIKDCIGELPSENSNYWKILDFNFYKESECLPKNNTKEYYPKGKYNPATKLYVDELIDVLDEKINEINIQNIKISSRLFVGEGDDKTAASIKLVFQIQKALENLKTELKNLDLPDKNFIETLKKLNFLKIFGNYKDINDKIGIYTLPLNHKENPEYGNEFQLLKLKDFEIIFGNKIYFRYKGEFDKKVQDGFNSDGTPNYIFVKETRFSDWINFGTLSKVELIGDVTGTSKDGIIETKISDRFAKKSDLGNFAKKSDLENFALKSEIPNTENFANKSELDKFANKSELDKFAKKSELDKLLANTGTKISSIFDIPVTYNYAIEQNNISKYNEYKTKHLNDKIYVQYGSNLVNLPLNSTSKVIKEADVKVLGTQTLKIQYKFSDNSTKDITINFNVVKPPKIIPEGKTITVAKDTVINPKMFISNLGKVEKDIQYSFINNVSTKSDGQFSIKIKALFNDDFECIVNATLIVKTYYDDFIITDSQYGKNTHYTLNIDKYYNKIPDLPDIKKEAKILEIHKGIKKCEFFEMPNYENVEEFKYNLDFGNYYHYFYKADFSNFKNIKEFKFPKGSFEYMFQESKFLNWKNVKEFIIPKECKNLESTFRYAKFSGWESVEKFILPEINAYETFYFANFSNWTSVKEFIIPDKVKFNKTFYFANFPNWTSVKEFKLPKEPSSFDSTFEGANFSGWTSIKEFIIPKYNYNTFDKTDFSGWTSLEYLEVGCINPSTNFKGCNNLLHLKIDIQTGLGDEQFNNLPKLNNLELVNVSHIGNKTFSNNPSLTSLNIPNSTGNIEYGAFMDCNGIVNVTIGTGIKTINSNCFKGCTSLTNFTINAVNPPILYGDIFDNSSIPTIKVPNASLSKYKNSSSWQKYSSKIVGF